MRYRPIGDYAIIGDTRSAALISSEGSLDWLCFPRFDSPAMFLRLLDAERGGYCWLRPAGHFEVSRGYVRDSCLLQTRFKTSTGTMNVIDFMPVRRTKDNDRKGTDTEAAHQVIRLVQCTGDVDCIIEIKATPDYAREKPKIVRRNDHRAVILGARDALHVQVPAPCEVGDDGVLRGKLPMNDGDEFALVLAWSEPEADVREVSLNDARRTLEETADYWREWSNDLEYEGDYRELVH